MSETSDTFAARVRLKRVEVRNYQSVKCAIFNVMPGINDLAGIPAQGKSTIPQAIAELFIKGGVSSMPLRRGAGDGLIRAEMDDGSVIEKKITPKGAQPVRRTDAEGNKQGIDHLSGWISEDVFKPLAFAALADTKAGRRAQAEIIAELVGLDTAKVDADRATHLGAESAAKKAAEELEAQARGVVVPDAPATISDELDVAAIAGRKGEVQRVIAANAEERRKAKEAEKAHEDAAARAVAITEEIEALERKLEHLRGRAARAIDETQAKWNRWQELAAAAEKLVDPSTAEIDAEIEQAKEHNARVAKLREQAAEHQRRAAEREALLSRAKAKRDEERAAGGRKRDCDALKAEMIAGAAARMPVPGLTIEGEGSDREVYLNGVPLSQASTMQRMQLGCALALARQPKLGFLWIDYGNELDEKALEWLQGFLEANNADAFVVHVIEADEVATADGLIVEGGEIKADRRKTRKARAAAPVTSAAAPVEVAAESSASALPTDDEPPTL